MTRASVAGTLGSVSLAVSEGELGHQSGSVLGPTSDLATGIAPPGTAGHTTSPAALAASNAVRPRMTLVVVPLIVTFHALEVATDLDGNLETGFAPGEIYVANCNNKIHG